VKKALLQLADGVQSFSLRHQQGGFHFGARGSHGSGFGGLAFLWIWVRVWEFWFVGEDLSGKG
jgi:hypothetical protein